ncbi:MAG: trehalase family glycosidase [Victivallaceae bacterium]|nr:trehalase family glycosidase [Victivallaceae bacterium]
MKINLLDLYGKGQLLAFSGLDGQTDFDHGLVLRTGEQKYSLELKLPVAGTKITFPPQGECFLSSGAFRFGTSAGVFPDAHHLLIQGPVEFSSLPTEIMLQQKEEMTLLGVKQFFRPEHLDDDFAALFRQRTAYLEQLKTLPFPSEAERKTFAKAVSQLHGQILAPEGRIRHRWSTPDRWPHRAMWLWDSVFHAVGIAQRDPHLALDLIEALLDCQQPDGMIPHQISTTTSSHITQPPIIAWGIGRILQRQEDLSFLRRVFPRLKAYLAWDVANRDCGNGLLAWAIEGDKFCRSGESGMDNSPRFDDAAKLAATDFNSFLSREYELLSEFAAKLELPGEAAEYHQKHLELNAKINEFLWDDPHSFYYDFDPALGCRSRVAANAGFLPLLCGAPDPDMAGRMVQRLLDPEDFGTPTAVPTISKKCPTYYSKDMWRGPVWINLNCLIAEGLARYHFDREARALRSATKTLLEQNYLQFGTFFEFYDDRAELPPPELLRKGCCDPNNPYHQAFFDYGWSAALYLELCAPGMAKCTESDGGSAH